MAYEHFGSAKEGGGYFDMSLKRKEKLTLGRSGIAIGIKKMALEL